MNAYWSAYNASKGAVDDIATNFAQAQKKNALEAAMRGYAMNPDDPNAVNALAQVDPAMAIQVRQQQAAAKQREIAAQRAAVEAQRENIITGARIIRELKPTDDASWQQALVAAQRMGVDISEVPPAYDPQYVQGLIATADALKPENQGQPTSLERNYRFFQETAPELAPKYLNNQANPPRFVPDGAGGFIAIDPAAFAEGQPTPTAGGPQPGQIEDGYRFKGGDPARPENWEPVSGGPTPSASGGFPY